MANPLEKWNALVEIGDSIAKVSGEFQNYEAYQAMVKYVKSDFKTNAKIPQLKYIDAATGKIKQTTGSLKRKTITQYFNKFTKTNENTHFKSFSQPGIRTSEEYRTQVVKLATKKAKELTASTTTPPIKQTALGVKQLSEIVGDTPAEKQRLRSLGTTALAAGSALGGAALSAGGALGLVASGSIPPLQSTPEGFKTPTFVGPGTDVLGKIKSKELPVNPVDMVALEHDIAYGLADTNAKVKRADNRFIKRLKQIAKLYPDDEYNAWFAGSAIQVKSFFDSYTPKSVSGGVWFDDQEWLSKQSPDDQKLLKTLYKKINKMSSKKFVESFRDPEIYSTLGASRALALVPGQSARGVSVMDGPRARLPKSIEIKDLPIDKAYKPPRYAKPSKALSLVKGEGVRDIPVMEGVNARLPKSIEIKELPVRKARPMTKALNLVKGEGVRDVPVMEGVKARLPYDIEITDPNVSGFEQRQSDVSRFEQQQILKDLQTKLENMRVQKLKETETSTFNRSERKFRPEVREFNPERLNVFLSRKFEAEEARLFANFNYVQDDPLKPQGGDNPLYRDNLINDAIRYGYTILLPKDYQPTGTNVLVSRPGVKPQAPVKIPQSEDVDIPANNSKKSFRTLDKSIYRNLRKNRV